jgi:Mg-chelatase subunit ChlD
MVAAALAAIRPELVLVEGPPEADALVAHVGQLTPPVALLMHDESEPSTAAFWPFAGFSPEWQAMRWAEENQVPLRFADLPASASLGEEDEPDRVVLDPLGVLAEAAGFDDPERWWEDVVEHPTGIANGSTDPLDLAAAVAEAMTALREEFADHVGRRTLRREASMRQVLRQGLKDVEGPIVVVCGAWHVPALRTLPTAVSDTALLRGLPRKKISGTWVPWSHGRLAAAAGYGAGVASPGWYSHLWQCADAGDAVPRWFAKACQVLRREDLPASTASAVEAVRLADALAAMRGRPSPGLVEISEATLAVLCGGDDTPLRLVHDQLVVGEELGQVGSEVPRSPLAADLERLQRKLRLPATATERQLRLDLRKDIDRERSKLLRRLRVLDVPWGEPDSTRGLGTFAEAWRIRWDPSLAVAVASAARNGTTVEAASDQVLCHRADGEQKVAKAAEVLWHAVGCELPAAVGAARRALDRCAAAATDAVELLSALPSLASTVRYGSVRGTDPELLQLALHGLLARGAVGLPLACRNVDDDTADHLMTALDAAQEAAGLAADAEHQVVWRQALVRLVELDDAHGLPAGRATRLLWEAGELDTDTVAARLHRAVSTRASATAFIAGFLRGSAALLAADPRLFDLVDEWLTGLSSEGFEDALPLLRRAVSEFSSAERRTLGDRVGSRANTTPAASGDWDEERAERLADHVRGLLPERVVHNAVRESRALRRSPLACLSGRLSTHAKVTTGAKREQPSLERYRGGIVSEQERLRRWRLLLGSAAGQVCGLGEDDQRRDSALTALYGGGESEGGPRGANLGSSAPVLHRWLGDVRNYFPTSVVQVMQRDAVERLGLNKLLLEPELLSTVEPDVHLVGTLVSLSRAIPARTRETARAVVRKVVEEIERRLADRMHAAVHGAIDRARRTRRPRMSDVDWNATIKANLRHYQPDQRTLVVSGLIGRQRRSRNASLRDVVLLVDQSGSMAESVVYSAVFGAVLASIRSVRTRLVVFDTEVVDLTEHLDDPVDLLFSTQLGGGTDINRAVAYGQSLVSSPADTVMVLISDLFEGGIADELQRRVRELVASGVTVVVLLALSDSGTPAYDHELAAKLSALGAPAFACTPDRFPDLLATALRRDDVAAWAEQAGMGVGR